MNSLFKKSWTTQNNLVKLGFSLKLFKNLEAIDFFIRTFSTLKLVFKIIRT